MEYTAREMMTIAAAREIRDGDIVFCGTGISMLAAMAAKKITAANSVIFFETGAIDPELEEIPLTVADSRIMHGSAANASMLDAFAAMQNPITGSRVVGILGAAQIDKLGNLNTTCLGDYERPRTRFPGSGGGCDVLSFVSRCIVFMQQEKRKFVRNLDYVTSPGYLDGPRGREEAGLPPGGPDLVVSDMGVFRFGKASREMYLAGYYAGTDPETILEHMQFSVDLSRAEPVRPPSAEELRILRTRCDPQRLIL
jgi:glutaconate CoA-transferase subunit B